MGIGVQGAAPERVSVLDSIGRAWTLIFEQPLMFLAMGFIVLIVAMPANLVGLLQTWRPDHALVASPWTSLVTTAWSLLLVLPFVVGLQWAGLRAGRNTNVNAHDFVHGWRHYGRVLVGYILPVLGLALLAGVLTVISIVLLAAGAGAAAQVGVLDPQVLPLFVFFITALMFLVLVASLVLSAVILLVPLVILDQRVPVGSALKRGVALTKGHFWPIIGFLVLKGIAEAIAMVTLGLAGIVVVPLFAVATGEYYRRIVDQGPLHRDAAPGTAAPVDWAPPASATPA